MSCCRTSRCPILLITLILCGSALLSGCITSQEYVDKLEILYRNSQEQIAELNAQLKERESDIAVLKSTIDSQDPEVIEKLKRALASHDKLTEALAKAEDNLRQASTTSGITLDPELDAALIRLAQSTRLISYEPQKGMLKFHSDLTFPPGSAQVGSEAANELSKLASILNARVGSQYTVRIVGHTDNVPIGRPETRAKHPTNWHLSVHRAIAVKDTLVKASVEQTRMGVSGYGEHRPISPNGPKGNPLNRRVEIYLLRYEPPDTAGGRSSLGNTPSDMGNSPPPMRSNPRGNDGNPQPDMYK
jgi:chemotaxis protein MotB